jgi:hypothetical protein
VWASISAFLLDEPNFVELPQLVASVLRIKLQLKLVVSQQNWCVQYPLCAQQSRPAMQAIVFYERQLNRNILCLPRGVPLYITVAFTAAMADQLKKKNKHVV